MAIEKLIQNGENENRQNVFSTGLGFVRAMNNNADELGTATKLDLEKYNTPEALAKAFKEQTNSKVGYRTPGGPDDLSMGQETSNLQGGAAQVYNKAVENAANELNKPSVEGNTDNTTTETPEAGTEQGEEPPAELPNEEGEGPTTQNEDNYVIDEEE